MKRLICKGTCYEMSGTLSSTHSVTHWLTKTTVNVRSTEKSERFIHDVSAADAACHALLWRQNHDEPSTWSQTTCTITWTHYINVSFKKHVLASTTTTTTTTTRILVLIQQFSAMCYPRHSPTTQPRTSSSHCSIFSGFNVSKKLFKKIIIMLIIIQQSLWCHLTHNRRF